MTGRRSILTTVVGLGLATGGPLALAPAYSAAATCHGLRATIMGTSASETLMGTPHRDVIVARGGNDIVHAAAGSDVVCGGAGGDVLFGGAGDDILDGQLAGRDEEGNLVANRMLPGTGRNRVLGDHVNRFDVVDLHTSPYGLRVDLQAGTVRANATRTVLRDVTHVIGTPYADVVRGSTGSDSIEGGDGHDSLRGAAGADFVAGGAGPDAVYGGTGDDDLYDGTGADTVGAGPGDDDIHLAAGENSVDGGGGHNAIYFFPGGGVTATLPTEADGVGVFEGGLTGTFSHIAAFIGSDHDDTYVVPNPFLYSSLLASNGVDTLDLSGYPGRLDVDLDAGTITSGDLTTSIQSFENVIGAEGPGRWPFASSPP